MNLLKCVRFINYLFCITLYYTIITLRFMFNIMLILPGIDMLRYQISIKKLKVIVKFFY